MVQLSATVVKYLLPCYLSGMVRVSLDRYLERHNISAYRLAKETAGRVARGSVFALARGEKVKRVDLETFAEVLTALERITGRAVGVADLLEVVPDLEPDTTEAPEASGVGPARLNLPPGTAALLEEARDAVKVRPGRSLAPGERFVLPEPVELTGEGASTSELVVEMRRSRPY